MPELFRFVVTRRSRVSSTFLSVVLSAMSCFSPAPASAEDIPDEVRQALDASVRGGLIVQLSCPDPQQVAELRRSQSYQVQGLDRDPGNVERARRFLVAQGINGEISVARLRDDKLPYADNMVNLLYAADPSDIEREEMLRVLVPEGVAVVQRDGRWTRLVKPRPDDIDQWTHYMYDSTGNAVAHDDVVGPPRHLQWLGDPLWSRHHDRMASISALVSANGRIFYVADEGSRVSIQLPAKWKLIARDAFNGTVLWKKDIPQWHSHLWPLKSGPTQLARRLVTDGDRVFVTLGFRAPLTVLDATTGEVLRTLDDSEATEEVIQSDGTLLLVVNRGTSELSSYVPLHNLGDQRRVAQEWSWNSKPRDVVAYDVQSGQELWRRETIVAPITLAADGTRVLLHDGQKLVCLDKTNGEVRWTTSPVSRRERINFNFGPKVVVHQDVVLYAGGDRAMRAFDLASGDELWQAPHPQSGYNSPEDLLVSGGLVWSAPTTRTADSGVYTGRDPRTGEVKAEFPPDVSTYWFHHRCYIAKATDRFLIPSRTGVEFVDHRNQDWEIHHWVRGGCLYGVMPCNGLIYTPPHNCACYPEAKLSGFNVMAPASEAFELPTGIPWRERLDQGPAYESELDEAIADDDDWPTYRHDAARSGRTSTELPDRLATSWTSDIGGRLSAVVVADGTLFVSQVDAHSVHALDARTGEKRWSFTAGGRVDSPPTIRRGRAVFGCADGRVYCVRASDGQLAWSYRAAPMDRRVMALGQLESLWPVHGSVLVRDDAVYCVAGRSVFLDGGMRWLKLDLKTGEPKSEQTLDDRDPDTGRSLQDRIQVLNMPVGLPDILSSDGNYVYMRSQRFDFNGRRFDLGPHSGQPAVQGSAQGGETAHLFSPTGFLDGTWFHRSYWVYGRSFAGGHAGYYQAGKYAPGARIMVFDQENVYGYGRKPEYYRWTTVLEHRLFASKRVRPTVDAPSAARAKGSMVRYDISRSLDPTGEPVAVEAWVKADRPGGVVLARGGPSLGYSLSLNQGVPRFQFRTSNERLATVAGTRKITGRWTHLLGMATRDDKLKLFVDGKLVATAEHAGLIAGDPKQSLQIGSDDGSAVGDYRSPRPLTGAIDEVKIFYGPMTDDEARARFDDTTRALPADALLVLACSFDEGNANDVSGYRNHGVLEGVQSVEGRIGKALRFSGRAAGNSGGGTTIEHHWNADAPLFARAMILAGRKLAICGPPDMIDEEQTFRQLTEGDPRVQELLRKQDDALEGKHGAVLRLVSADDGSTLTDLHLPSAPVWDGMAASSGRLYLATTDGKVYCLE